MSLDELIRRIQGEFHEMPGLRLTLTQACWIWQVDLMTCRSVFAHLLKANVVYKTDDGYYMAVTPMPFVDKELPKPHPAPTLPR